MRDRAERTGPWVAHAMRSYRVQSERTGPRVAPAMRAYRSPF